MRSMRRIVRMSAVTSNDLARFSFPRSETGQYFRQQLSFFTRTQMNANSIRWFEGRRCFPATVNNIHIQRSAAMPLMNALSQ